MLIKTLTIVGMCLTGLGTVLLWRGSPSGYALGAMGGRELIEQVNANNKRMRRKQNLAIALIILGTSLQFPSVLLS